MTDTSDDIGVDSRWLSCLHVVLVLLTLAGCVSGVPPQFVATDRMSYGEVIADSWKHQTLLNVVRLRYADTPVFLEVASVINSYSLAGRANAGAATASDMFPAGFNIGAEGSWSNTPTVTYQPLTGDRLAGSLLQPVPPAAVFQLLQGGWSADLVLTTVAVAISGLRNDSGGIGEDPDFRILVEVLSRIQQAGALRVRVEPRDGGNAIVVALRQANPTTAVAKDLRTVRRLLRLDEDVTEFEISPGLDPRNAREVTMVSRSMLEILLRLGEGIELPATDVADGRVTPERRQPGDVGNPTIARIHSAIAMPTDTYAAVHYRDHWYWIDDKDFASKRVFTFLLILFSLAETNQASAAPVVTVPAR